MKDRVIEYALLLVAFSAVAAIFLIAIFIFTEGLPLVSRVGLVKFIAGTDWSPGKGHFGILPMIIGSLCVTLLAIVVGAVLGLSCAILLAEFTPPGLVRILKPLIELLAGIPSVVYGFMGVVVLVPLIRRLLGGPGF